MAMDKTLIRVALGKESADIIIRNGMLVNVMTGEIYKTDIAIKGERIASIGPLPDGMLGPDTRFIDAEGYYLAPGFIDAHIHIESSMLTYTEFSKMVVRRGTTAVASDLMEVTIVSGIEGMKEFLAESKKVPVRLYYPVPSFMEEETGLQTIGSVLHAGMIKDLLELPEAVGLAEVLVPPILAESPQSEEILKMAEQKGKTAEGHAPALSGAPLNAYAGTGIRSDHESTNATEALEKLRAGLRVLIREGSASADLAACIKIITEDKVDTRHVCMISDDIDALHIDRHGHLDHKVRMAVKAGVPPVQAIQMVTLNPAESLKIDHEAGSITPGKFADIVFLSSLEACRVKKVISKGQLVVDDMKLAVDLPEPRYSDNLLKTVFLKNKIAPRDLVIRVDEEKSRAKVWVIGASGTSLLTDTMQADLKIREGMIVPDIANDILHIACVERYGKNGGIGRSFIHGVGLKEGAIALSVGHDHHNISVVGCDPQNMSVAVERIAALNGGIVYARGGKVVQEISLPVCGLLSLESGEAVAGELKKMIEDLKAHGCLLSSPNVTLSFITLIFIPDLAITDQGLFDVKRFALIDPVIELQ
jgi:adenine deaminase